MRYRERNGPEVEYFWDFLAEGCELRQWMHGKLRAFAEGSCWMILLIQKVSEAEPGAVATGSFP